MTEFLRLPFTLSNFRIATKKTHKKKHIKWFSSDKLGVIQL